MSDFGNCRSELRRRAASPRRSCFAPVVSILANSFEWPATPPWTTALALGTVDKAVDRCAASTRQRANAQPQLAAGRLTMVEPQ